jgi:hypothetical protein
MIYLMVIIIIIIIIINEIQIVRTLSNDIKWNLDGRNVPEFV